MSCLLFHIMDQHDSNSMKRRLNLCRMEQHNINVCAAVNGGGTLIDSHKVFC